MTGDQDENGRRDRVKAGEPAPVASPAAGKAPADQGPEADNVRADAIDEDTAGDGVAFFEGGDGREDARGDIERNG